MEIKKGDIFILGQHKLMCGDSLSLIDLQKVLEPDKAADMIFCDPPYSVDYNPDKSHGRRVKKLGDREVDVTFYASKLLDLFNTGIVKGAVYICCGYLQQADIFQWTQKNLKHTATHILWVKPGLTLTMKDYHSQHESLVYYYYPEKKFRGNRDQSDVWFIGRRNVNQYNHPTQKPVRLVERAILNSSDEGDTVLDPFCGSGTTLIACERQKRMARCIELDPKYVQATIDRWEALTGRKVVKLDG